MGNNPVSGIDPTGGVHVDKDGNVVADATDNDTYALFATVNLKQGEFFWNGDQWISNEQQSDSRLESMYWSAVNKGNNPFQGAYGVQIKAWSQSWAAFQSGYNIHAKALDISSKAATATIYLGAGGLSGMATGAGGSLITTQGWATRGAVSLLSQAVAEGPKNIDMADVISDAIFVPGFASVTDGVVDWKPFSDKGPRLAVAGVNKDINRVGYESAANLIVGKVADLSMNNLGNVIWNVNGKAGTDIIGEQMFGK